MTRTNRWVASLVAGVLVAACAAPGGTSSPAGGSASPAGGSASPGGSAASPSGGSAGPSASASGPVSAYSARINEEKATTVDTSKWAKDGPYTVGFTSQGTFNGFGLMLDATVRWAASQNDEIAQLVGSNGDGDPNRQISIVEDLVQQGVDIIILQPLGHAALSAPVDRATAAGVPVVTCLDGVESDSYVTRVDVDLYKIAYEVTTAMAEDMGGTGNAIILSGIPGVDAAEIWADAANDALANYPDIKLVGTEFSGWSIAEAKTLTTQLLSRAGQIDGVYAGGAENAIGAINAFEEAGVKMPVFGVTNPLNGFLRLAIEHNIVFTAAPDPPGTSALCVDYALRVLRGEEVPKFVDIAEEVDGAGMFDESEAAARYDDRYNDDYTFPTMLPHDQLIEAGFGR
jgi:ribose transport system substrate-binding protein